MLKELSRLTFLKFKAAFEGVYAGMRYDKSILVQVILAIGSVFFFWWLDINTIEWLFVVSAIFVVLITEFLNSAIEDICDLLIKEYHLHVKEIKDIAAAAVLIAAFYAIAVAGIIIIRRFL